VLLFGQVPLEQHPCLPAGVLPHFPGSSLPNRQLPGAPRADSEAVWPCHGCVTRTDQVITYEPAGMPGSFDLAIAEPLSDTAAAAAAGGPDSKPERDQQQRQAAAAGKDPVYIFACHPTGLLSRGAFCTFAARGQHSPVSGLRRVRLAIGSQLLRVPMALGREFLLAAGCVPADASHPDGTSCCEARASPSRRAVGGSPGT